MPARQDLRGENQKVTGNCGTKKTKHGARPEIFEVREVIYDAMGLPRTRGKIRIDGDLYAAGAGNAAVHKGDAGKDGFHKGELLFPIAVHQFLPAVIVAEVAIETDFGKLPGDLHGSPEVLCDGCPVRFNKHWQSIPERCCKDGFDQAGYFGIIFNAPADMEGHAEIAAIDVTSCNGVGFLRGVDSIQTAMPKPQTGFEAKVVRKLNTFEPVGLQALETFAASRFILEVESRMVNEGIEVQKHAHTGRIGGTVVEKMRGKGHGAWSEFVVCDVLCRDSQRL